jgi:hypothetical protein
VSQRKNHIFNTRYNANRQKQKEKNVKTSSAKAKGRRLCQKIKEKLDKLFDFKDGDVTVTPSGVRGEDLQLSPFARHRFPYSVEAKNQEALNFWKALEQAESNCRGMTPVLIFSRNRSKTYAVVEVDHFLELAASDYKLNRFRPIQKSE